MRYVLLNKGRYVRSTKTLREALASRAYSPWSGGSEIWEVRYDSNNQPVYAVKI
jgi:hypothetical protein